MTQIIAITGGIGSGKSTLCSKLKEKNFKIHSSDEQVANIYKNPNKKFEVVSNPEFLREGSAITDFENPDRIIVGTSNIKAIESIKEIYKRQIEKDYPIIFTSRRSSELIKYASNSMLAMRIIFINEI